MNILPSTWAFKCKGYPDGWIKKFKAHFCAQDITAAFVHANLPPTKEVYVDIFTKGLRPISFKYLRLKLMGWYNHQLYARGSVGVDQQSYCCV